VLEIRLRVLAYGPHRFLGIAEGFPEVLVFSKSPEAVEIDLTNAVEDRIRCRMNFEVTSIDWDDFPTVRSVRLYLGRGVG
jgi:hypothetical protein